MRRYLITSQWQLGAGEQLTAHPVPIQEAARVRLQWNGGPRLVPSTLFPMVAKEDFLGTGLKRYTNNKELYNKWIRP